MTNNPGRQPDNTNRPQEQFENYKPATAPYNFVPLPEEARTVEFPPDFLQFGDTNEQGNNLYSGYFEFTLETLTPLYIRSTLTEDEFAPEERLQKPQFYSPGFKAQPGTTRLDIRPYLRIPGSSLRGMTRTLVEILSEGFFDNISKQAMFYRAVFDKSSIGKTYGDQMVSMKKVRFQNQQREALYPAVKAGYLYKQGNVYFIRPSKVINGLQYFRVEHTTVEDDGANPLATHQIDGLKSFDERYSWEKRRVWFRPTTPGPRLHNNGRVVLFYGLLKASNINTESTPPGGTGWEEGFFLATGFMKNKHMHWVVTPPDPQAGTIKIPDEDISAYKTSGGGLTPKVKKEGFSVLPDQDNEEARPCFYIERKDHKGKKRIGFGHTPLFRLLYWHTPEDLIPDKLKTPEGSEFDMAEAIFGVATGDERGKSFAGRVFFEDAFFDPEKTGNKPIGEIEEPSDSIAKVLGSPKPTTFQHYLAQDEAITAFNKADPNSPKPADQPESKRKRALNHWDTQRANDTSGAKLRGYKLYWHRSGSAWQEDRQVLEGIRTRQLSKEVQEEETQRQLIRPVKKGVWFRFRVRFTNLRDYELGALATALELPEGCAHKLGMGKPLGLGSVQLRCEGLHLITRSTRYTKLLEIDAKGEVTSSWATGESSGNLAEFKKAFAAWLLKKNTNATDPAAIWQIDRLKELRRMLDIEEKPADKDTSYLRIPNPDDPRSKNEYSERNILPRPTEVKSQLRPVRSGASGSHAPATTANPVGATPKNAQGKQGKSYSTGALPANNAFSNALKNFEINQDDAKE
jgi:CRISPR-associated protein (TIGR03986 family)